MTMVRDVFSLPHIDNALDALASAKYFTILNAWTGYQQVPLDPQNAPKTGFITCDGCYEFVVMPFRLVNAPGEFQWLMNLTLHSLTWHTCLVYLDDIIVFSATFEEHLVLLEQVFDWLEQADIQLKLLK